MFSYSTQIYQVDVPVQQSYLYYSSSIGGTDDSPVNLSVLDL